ncbi:Poly(beta-D-mannuronate) C5 epimerase 1 [compost metagenome]
MKTYNEIITELSNANASGHIYSLTELHDLVSQASGGLSDNTTLTSYYSGSAFLDQDVSTGLYQESISVNSYGEIGRISQTDVSRLAENIAFLDALENTLNSMGVIDYDQFDKEGTAAYEFWNGSGGIEPSTGEHVPSIWNTISEVYARDTKGDVLALVPFADDNRIWAQTELPTLLDNPNVTSINGIPIDELRTNLQSNGYSQVFEDIKTQSVLIMSEFQYVRDTSTGRIAAVDTGQVLSKYFGVEDVTIDPFITIQNPTYEIRPQYEAYGYSEIYNSQLGSIRETHIQNSPYLTDIQKSHFLEVAGKAGGVLGPALTVLGLIALSSQVQAAETSEQKQQIIDDWIGHTTAEWIAGSIGSALVVGGVAALTAVSAPVTLGLAIVSGIVGSIVGGDTVYDYIKNGVNALLDDIKTWLFGEKAINSNGLSNYEESAHLFDLAQKVYRVDPLTLDLDHDGLETRAPSTSSTIMFDHTGTGIKTSTGWVLPDDGFLVLDRNNNGTIDNGTELFGDSTPLMNGSFAKNGFEALADQDTNQDGKVDAQDTNWLALKVWRDLNQDGISQANELFSMSALDIDGIHVSSSRYSQVLENGNEIAELGTYYKTNGSQEVLGGVSHMADVNLVNDTFHRTFTDNIAISPEVALLPNVIGAGKLRDLHEAMMQSEQLKTLVQQFSIETDYLAQRSLVQDIIKAWVETDTSYQSVEQRAELLDISYLWVVINGQKDINHILNKDIYDQLWNNLITETEYKLKVLEVFNGRYYFKLPEENSDLQTAQNVIHPYRYWEDGVENMLYGLLIGTNQMAILEASYNNIVTNIQNSLLLQTHFKPLIDLIQIVYDETKGIVVDSTQLDQYFEQKIEKDFNAGISELYDFSYSTYFLMNNENLSYWIMLNDALRKHADSSQATSLIKSLGVHTSIDEIYTDLIESDLRVIMLGSENDSLVLQGYDNNVIFSGDGDDMILGGMGRDILSGGKGNDDLNGSYGINTYIFNKGDGADRINSIHVLNEKFSVETYIILDVLAQDISVDVSSNYIILKIKGTNDQLYIEDALSANLGLKTITFADQMVWTITDILAQPLLGSENDDYLIGIDARDNKIYGFEGNDNLYGAIGNDYLDGGTGDDYLDGGYGINTYYFDRGYANDVIIAPYLTPESAPTETHVQLGILPDDISVELFDQSIRIIIKDSGDILEIQDAFVENSAFKTITFADQSVWTSADILAQPLLGTEGDDYLVGLDVRDNKIYGFAGDDYLYGSIGNDYLDGGTGDDELNGGDGINTYVFNRGYGYDSINTPYLDENSPQIETHILMDVLPSDISVEISYQDVFISLNNTDDLLEIRGVFTEFSAFKTITFADQTVWTIHDLQNFVSMDSNQDESLTDLLNDSSDMISYHDEYDYLFDELSDNQSLVGQLGGNNTQVLTDSLVLEESSDVDYQFNLLTIEDMQKFNIDVDKLLKSTNVNSESEDTQNVKNSLTQKYQLDEVDDQIVFDNTSFSIPNNIGLWNTLFNQQFIA